MTAFQLSECAFIALKRVPIAVIDARITPAQATLPWLRLEWRDWARVGRVFRGHAHGLMPSFKDAGSGYSG